MFTQRDSANPATKRRSRTLLLLWGLIALYAVARVLPILPANIPILAIVALHVLLPVIFAGIHGTMLYRPRGALVFVAVCIVVGNMFENLGVRTGFPFGRYYFTDVMGPKILVVPILLGLAYVGMAYLSWILGSLILGGVRSPLTGPRVVTLPLIASFLMVAWDISMDPVWSTIVHAWIWSNGGSYFGVPLTNFFGWFLTVYVFYQLFAIYLRARPSYPPPLPPGFWRLPVVFYAASACGNLLLAIRRPSPSVVTDPSGVQWKVGDILAASALGSIFIMGAFALIAWVRIADIPVCKEKNGERIKEAAVSIRDRAELPWQSRNRSRK